MSSKSNICLSGGADGADIVWGMAAETAGHEVVHWTFAGHKSNANYLCELNDSQLRIADHYLELANKSLQRKWPTKSPTVNNLLRRNFYQVYYSDRVYAVSSIKEDNSLLHITGGTAWACQMFVDKWLYNTHTSTKPGLYIFDQISNNWYEWNGQWHQINLPPRPEGIYAGIGSREITDAGTQAILNVYG